MAVDAEAPEWKRRRWEQRIALASTLGTFIWAAKAAIDGKDTATLQVLIYASLGGVLTLAGIRAWTGLSRLKNGKAE